jgi:hypothetical protein
MKKPNEIAEMSECKAAEIVKGELIRIVQDPEMKQLIGRGKGVQMPIFVNILGDTAINKLVFANAAKAPQEDLVAVMNWLLKVIPEPRLDNIKALAIGVSIRRHGQLNPAARELGISLRAVRYLKEKAARFGLPIGEYLGHGHAKYIPRKLSRDVSG